VTIYRFKLRDESLGDIDFATVQLKEAFAIKAASGLTVVEMLNGLAKADPDCLQTVVWFLKFRRGEVVDRGSIDFALNELDAEIVDEAGPKPPTPSSQNGINTSGHSPIFATSDPTT